MQTVFFIFHHLALNLVLDCPEVNGPPSVLGLAAVLCLVIVKPPETALQAAAISRGVEL